ncbi:MAG: threonine/serine dehydratase [Planctomycetes bacterium]|nr:threonine/serine dehydratase [Planctomycetota bacterium]
MIPIAEIRSAAARLQGKLHRTSLMSSHILGDMAGVQLYLKCECLQKTGSFKARGALNKVLSLTPAEQKKGLITVSAGNHAAAVAYAAKSVGAPCVVVMPSDAPKSKIEAVRGYGAEIVFHDDRPTLFDKLKQEQAARGSTVVHPFDDPMVLAGAATVGLEILEDLPELDIVLVPVGGGGLMGGVASVVKHLRPQARVIAVELQAGPGLSPALEAGKPVPVKRPPGTLADGMTPPYVGELPLKVAREAVDEVVGVSEDEIVNAMRLLMTRTKLYVEGSGASATAALLAGKVKAPRGAKVASIISGGNVDLESICAKVVGAQR